MKRISRAMSDSSDTSEHKTNSPVQFGEMAVVSDSVRSMIIDVDVKAAVASLNEGKFLLKYCHNSFRKVSKLNN